jgi:hypothetical protein
MRCRAVAAVQHAVCKKGKIASGPNHMRRDDVTAGSTKRCGKFVLNLLIDHFIRATSNMQ